MQPRYSRTRSAGLVRVPDRRQLVGWDVLRDEILFGAGHAVVVGPAVNDRQSLAPVAMYGRRIGCLPFERRGLPRVAARGLALEERPDQVEQEHQLHGGDEQSGYGDPLVYGMSRRRNELDGFV